MSGPIGAVRATRTEVERVTRVAPFGVRFWDPVTGTAVGPGLDVTVRRPGRPAAPRTAVPGPSGVYVVRGLPTTWEWERDAGDDVFWADAPASTPYRVEVRDRTGRFLPLAFDVELPVRGLVTSTCVAPAVAVPLPSPHAPVVPLFSAPGRPVPPGTSVVRAQLAVQGSAGPGSAAWALLAGTVLGVETRTVLGLADCNGNAVLMLARPETPDPEPDGAAGDVSLVRLPDQTWPMDLAARLGPADQPVLVDGVPDLCRLLDQPTAGLLADDTTEPSTPLTQTVLRYGRETVLKTGTHSSLLLTRTA